MQIPFISQDGTRSYIGLGALSKCSPCHTCPSLDLVSLRHPVGCIWDRGWGLTSSFEASFSGATSPIALSSSSSASIALISSYRLFTSLFLSQISNPPLAYTVRGRVETNRFQFFNCSISLYPPLHMSDNAIVPSGNLNRRGGARRLFHNPARSSADPLSSGGTSNTPSGHPSFFHVDYRSISTTTRGRKGGRTDIVGFTSDD